MTHTHQAEPAPEQNGNDSTGPQMIRRPSPACLRRVRIRLLNDALRITGRGGIVLMTEGIAALGLAHVNAIFAALALFAGFTADNDPYGEHDFGALEVAGERVLFKVDYYAHTLTGHSPDPADPKVTVRVLTVMLDEEY